MEQELIDILPTDIVTEHPDAQSNKTLYIARELPDGRSMRATTKPDGTVILSWHELHKSQDRWH